MFRKVKKRLLSQADKEIPDKWTEIESAYKKTFPDFHSQKHSIHKRHYLQLMAAALCFCFVVVLSMLYLFEDNDITIKNPDTANSDSTTIESTTNSDNIVWNDNEHIVLGRFAIRSVSETEWKNRFPIDVPSTYEWEYYFQEELSKETYLPTDEVYTGVLSIKIDENKWCKVYINDRNVEEYYFPEGVTMSQISGVNALLYTEGTTNRIADFYPGKYNMCLECAGFSEKECEDLIRAFIQSVLF